MAAAARLRRARRRTPHAARRTAPRRPVPRLGGLVGAPRGRRPAAGLLLLRGPRLGARPGGAARGARAEAGAPAGVDSYDPGRGRARRGRCRRGVRRHDPRLGHDLAHPPRRPRRRRAGRGRDRRRRTRHPPAARRAADDLARRPVVLALPVALAGAGARCSPRDSVVLLAVALGLTLVSYHLVEQPFRRGRLVGRGTRALVMWPAALAAVLIGTSVAVAHADASLAARMGTGSARPAPLVAEDEPRPGASREGPPDGPAAPAAAVRDGPASPRRRRERARGSADLPDEQPARPRRRLVALGVHVQLVDGRDAFEDLPHRRPAGAGRPSPSTATPARDSGCPPSTGSVAARACGWCPTSSLPARPTPSG